MKHSPAPRGHGSRPAVLLSSARAVLATAVLVAAAILPLPASAQISTASLSVHVVGPDDDPLTGVAVEVLNSETGFERTGITDDNGNVAIQALPTGPYKIAAQLEGMAALAEQSLTLRVGHRAQMKLVLNPQLADTLTVTGETTLVDVYRMDSSTNIVPEQIESLPVADRQFEKLAFLAPGVQRDRTAFFDRTGAPVIGSAGNSGVATVLVDGVDFSDAFIGQSRLRLSQDSIREFRVIGQGFDAEVGGSSGGGLSIVTKSGTNDIQSSAFVFVRDKSLRATKALALEEADYSRSHVGFTLGGALARDRTHYFAALEHVDEDEAALVRPGGAFVALAADVVQPRKQTTALLRLDHSFSASTWGSAKLYWERYRRDNYEVGGVIDESHGWSWYRDVWTLAAGHTWVMGDDRLNELRLQLGERDMRFPANSTQIGEWFSYGSTLNTGGTILGDGGSLAGDFVGLRNTHHWQPGDGSHRLKAGFEYKHVESSFREDRFQNGLMIYETDDRSAPYAYVHGFGSGASTFTTDLYGLFLQDDWQVRDDLTLSAGLRYDLDTGSNIPDYKHPLVPDGRQVDTDNLQPRLSLSWAAGRNARTVVRSGIGRFVGRYNHYVTHTALGFDDFSGRFFETRVSLPGLILDPEDPQNTGYGLPPDISLLAEHYPTPESTQARLGLSRRLGATHLYLDAEVVYSKGKNEPVARNANWAGNSNPGWISPDYTDTNTFTAEGRSRYQSLSLGLKGTLRAGHLITAAMVLAEKQNIVDDPVTVMRPSDQADIDAEWGRADTDEGYRLVASGVFKLPWRIILSSLFEYGSGRPWNRIHGYDYNGDLQTSDRPEGVARNDQDGPRFSQLDLRLAKDFDPGGRGSVELSVEVFNLLDTVNYDVRSVDQAMYLGGPTLANPGVAYIPNPGFGTYRDTHRPRELQIGLRWRL